MSCSSVFRLIAGTAVVLVLMSSIRSTGAASDDLISPTTDPVLSSAAATTEPLVGKAESPFWLAAKISPDLAPVPVKLVSAPDSAKAAFALIQVGPVDPRTFIGANRPAIAPFVPAADTGYEVVPGGLKVGARVYGDRTYAIKTLPDALAGLPLLRTRNQDKAIVDGRFAIVVTTPRPCYVLVAIDEQALTLYKQSGAPGWLQEFAPTQYTVQTDNFNGVPETFPVFARKAAAGRIALGPPCSDVELNSMYFAFFSEAK